jgi:hypothetical protein
MTKRALKTIANAGLECDSKALSAIPSAKPHKNISEQAMRGAKAVWQGLPQSPYTKQT